MTCEYFPPSKNVDDLLKMGIKPQIEIKHGTLRGTTRELKLNMLALTSLEGIQNIPGVRSINSLNLSINNFTNFDISHLKFMPSLQYVAFYMNPIEADVEKMKSLRKDFENYKGGDVFLNTSVRYRLSDDELVKFKQNLFDKFGVYLGPDWK